jgi:glutamate formiminotransferase/formiminotetrahydrofolate cyclodeaminase
MTQPLLECVPNFSEGRDRATIERITDAIAAVDGVTLLDVDPGQATNRTVVTFVGAPEPVMTAAVRAAAAARDAIDMRTHQGEHPRFGAMDVCPLIPVAGVTMDEAAAYARELGKRLGEELGITVFCYEHAATRPERRNLAAVRAGEYEGLPDKLARPEWAPDFGPATFDPGFGAVAVGARDFLIAYNVNLNTTSTRRANAIAFDVREKGRMKRSGHPLTGEIVRGDDGEPVWIAGSLQSVKAIGWYIEEYGIAQISMNLTDIATTPLHVAFDEVCRKADARGIRVTGSEIVGLVPLRALVEAGEYFLTKQQRSLGVSERELIKIAVRSMGLDDLAPFEPDEKIIEYRLRDRDARRLVDQTVQAFVETTASEAPAPGGGSVAALAGALGAALATMVANLSSHKRGWDDRWEQYSQAAVEGKRYAERLLALVDEDTAAFDAVLAAMRLPKDSPADQEARAAAIEAATQEATRVPFRVMEAAVGSMDVIHRMAESGLASSASDAGVGAICARAAVRGAYLNVQINAATLADRAVADDLVARGAALTHDAEARERATLAVVEGRM